MREADGLDSAGGLLAGDGVEVVVARGVGDVGDDAPVWCDDRRRLVVALDANEEFHRPRSCAIPPEGTRAERRLAPPGNEHDVTGVADPVPGHVVRLGVGDDGFGRAGFRVVNPEVEGAVALGREEDAGPVRRPARTQVEEGVGGEAARPAGRELGDEDVEVAVDVGRVGDPAALGGPARLGVVAGAARDLARGAALGGDDPDAALVGEGDGLAVGRPGRVGGRCGDGGREIAFHVHPARVADARERGVPAREGVGVFVLLGGGSAGGECCQRCHGQGGDGGNVHRRWFSCGARAHRKILMVGDVRRHRKKLRETSPKLRRSTSACACSPACWERPRSPRS